jgi:hypothetical protein
MNEQISGWKIEFVEVGSQSSGEDLNRLQAGPQRKVAKCRSMLELANRVLPPGVREEALDEWMDDVECAAEAKKPVIRRTLSILFRSLPSLALRSRRPARARGNGG